MRKFRVNPIIISALIFIFWIGLFVMFTGRLERESAAEQKEALESALERDITTCYALEGQFPPDLQYLRDHYGLAYDEDLFYVDYRPHGSNIRPFYIVLETETARSRILFLLPGNGIRKIRISGGSGETYNRAGEVPEVQS